MNQIEMFPKLSGVMIKDIQDKLAVFHLLPSASKYKDTKNKKKIL